MKYVMVTFKDGDCRVYTKRVANKRRLEEWNVNASTEGLVANVVAESTDKDKLLQMANLARHDYATTSELWVLGASEPIGDLADYTDMGKFP